VNAPYKEKANALRDDVTNIESKLNTSSDIRRKESDSIVDEVKNAS